MACNSSYLEPTQRERELRRAAKLLVWLREKRGLKVSQWMHDAAKSLYGDDRAVPALCRTIKRIKPADYDSIMHDAYDRNSRDLANWWEEHQEADAERERVEAVEKAVELLKQQGLAKLSVEERQALGFG